MERFDKESSYRFVLVAPDLKSVKRKRKNIARDDVTHDLLFFFTTCDHRDQREKLKTTLWKMASYLRRFATSASTGKNLYINPAFYIYSTPMLNQNTSFLGLMYS